MKRKIEVKFIRKEKRETDSGYLNYLVFLTKENKRLAIRQNLVATYLQSLIENENYILYLVYSTCQGIEYKDILIFNRGGRIVMKRQNRYYELNPTHNKKTLTDEKMEKYFAGFIEQF